MDAAVLVVLAFVSSMFTAVISTGGGVLLISVMPGLLPAAAVVPIHGVVQLGSTASRMAFDLGHVEWALVRRFAVGAAAGAALGAPLVGRVPPEVTPVLLGAFILAITWGPRPGAIRRIPGRFVFLGAAQAFLSLFVGAAGPLASPFLLGEELSQDRIVVTHAAFALIMHLFKVVAFGLLGFAFGAHLGLIGIMVVAVILGSWAGTRLRGRMPESAFRAAFKTVITLLALRLVARVYV